MTYLLVFLLVIINATAHIMLKIGSTQKNSKTFFSILNVQSALGYFFFFLSTLLTVYLLKFIEFKSMTLIVTLNYIGTLVLARFILKEKLSFKKYLALTVIILGIIVFNL